MGLLGTVAKTAVVSGTATATRNSINRRQADKNVSAYAHAQQQVPRQQVAYTQQAAPPGPQDDTVSQLERLGQLKAQGVLTDEEFQTQKAKILGT